MSIIQGGYVMRKNKHQKLRTFAALIAIATAIIHVANKFIVLSATFKEILDIRNKKYFDSKFGKIYYTKHGFGSPVLLIHDSLPGSSGYEWNRVEKLIAMEHTVYTIDLLGFGRSDKPGITYTNYLYVQLINEFVEKVIKEKTDVISSGFSGSFVVMASNNKELFNKVMLINPPSLDALNQQTTVKEELMAKLLKLPVFGTLIYHINVSRETINHLFSEKLYHNPAQIDRDMIDAYYEASHRGGYYAKYIYASFITNKLNVYLSNGIKHLEQDTMIVSGESEVHASSVVRTYTSLNDSIKFETIKNTKHYPHVETPDKFLSCVSEFIG